MRRAAPVLLVALLELAAGGYVHDPRKLKAQKRAEARGDAWGDEWALRRKAKLNSLLRALHAVAADHTDVVEWYSYHPEAMQADGVSSVSQTLVSSLGLLGGEGVDDHLLEHVAEDQELQELAEPNEAKERGGGESSLLPGAGGPPEQCGSGGGSSAPRCRQRVAAGDQQPTSGTNLTYVENVIVLASAPSHFEYRQTMRDTWLSPAALRGHDVRVLFAVGQVREPALEGSLAEEQAQHSDLLRTPSFDGYRNLSLKVFEAYELVQQRHTFRWMVRCDDNNIVRMDRVLTELAAVRRRPKGELRVWGNVHKDAIVHKDRMYRNYEMDFSAPAYPLFPTGCLHALTFETVSWVTCMRPELRRFKSADDTTLGIWLSVSPHPVRMSKSMYPVRDEGCKPEALLFRREDPPVTPAVIQKAHERWLRCGNLCECEGVGHKLDSGTEGTNWLLLPKMQTGYEKIVTAN